MLNSGFESMPRLTLV